MKNKIIDYFLAISNFLLVVGIVVTSILVIHYFKNLSDNIDINDIHMNVNEYYIPFYVLFFISAIFLFLHIYFKKQYLILVKMHLTKKTIRAFFISFASAIIILIFSTVWISCAPYLSSTDQLNWYFYVLIGITMLLTFINICLDAYARFGVKADLVKKRMGEPFGSENELVKKDQLVKN